MNKAELVEVLAARFGGNKAEAARALNAVVETIVHETAREGKVSITGFGVFETVQRPARTVRNPRTGERKEVPASTVPRFRAGADLRAYVAGEKAVPAPKAAAKKPAPKAATKKAAPRAAEKPAARRRASGRA